MESVLEKIKVLECQFSPCPSRLDRLSFVVKQSQQLELLLQVASWLCTLLGNSEEAVHYTSLDALVAGLAQRQFVADKVDLQRGHGEAVCRLLEHLCDGALVKQAFVWQIPVYDTPQEVAEEKHGDDQKAALPDTKRSAKAAASREAEAKVMSPPATPSVAEGKGTAAPLDEVESKEQRFRERLNHTRAQAAEMEGACQVKQGRVDALKKELARLQGKGDRLQQEEEATLREHQQLGAGIMDNAVAGSRPATTQPGPVAKLKAALLDLKMEIRDLDVRTGIIQHLLLQAQYKRPGTLFIQSLLLQRGDVIDEEDEE